MKLTATLDLVGPSYHNTTTIEVGDRELKQLPEHLQKKLEAWFAAGTLLMSEVSTALGKAESEVCDE